MTERQVIMNKDQWDAMIKQSAAIGKEKLRTFYRITNSGKKKQIIKKNKLC